jgi:hypothetical protein
MSRGNEPSQLGMLDVQELDLASTGGDWRADRNPPPPGDVISIPSTGAAMRLVCKTLSVASAVCVFGWKSKPAALPLEKSLIAKDPAIRAISYTSRMEAGRPFGHYDSLNARDRAGVSLGLIQFSAHSGVLQQLLARYKELSPEGFAEHFEPFYDIEQHGRHFLIVDVNRQLYTLQQLRHRRFCQRLMEACTDPLMRQAQRDLALEWYHRAERRAEQHGMTSQKAAALVMSISVNLGETGCNRRLAMTAGQTEKERLVSFTRAVLSTVGPGKRARMEVILEADDLEGPAIDWDEDVMVK